MFIEEFLPFLEENVLAKGKVMLMGDLNFHCESPDDADIRKFDLLLNNLCLHQYISKPTHKSGYILDVVITRSETPVRLILIWSSYPCQEERLNLNRSRALILQLLKQVSTAQLSPHSHILI